MALMMFPTSFSPENYSENLVSAGMNGLPARRQTVGRRCAAPAVRYTEHGVIDSTKEKEAPLC